MFVRNRLLSIMFVALIASSAAYGQSWLSQVELSTGEQTRKISLLNFDSKNSNISSLQASRAMTGFFTGLDAMGTYRINLNREYIGDGEGSVALLVATSVTFLAFLGVPAVIEKYRLTVRIDILDSGGNIVKTVPMTDNYTISKSLYNMFDVTQSEKIKMSDLFSRLIRQARNEINYEAIAINNRLQPPPPSPESIVEGLFNTLTANIPQNLPIAVLQIVGPDEAENVAILSTLNNAFVNSNKKFTVLNRANLASVYIERLNQMSQRLDESTVSEIGREIGAAIVVSGEIRVVNNQKTLSVFATDVQTLQVYGAASVNY